MSDIFSFQVSAITIPSYSSKTRSLLRTRNSSYTLYHLKCDIYRITKISQFDPGVLRRALLRGTEHSLIGPVFGSKQPATRVGQVAWESLGPPQYRLSCTYPSCTRNKSTNARGTIDFVCKVIEPIKIKKFIHNHKPFLFSPNSSDTPKFSRSLGRDVSLSSERFLQIPIFQNIIGLVSTNDHILPEPLKLQNSIT